MAENTTQKTTENQKAKRRVNAVNPILAWGLILVAVAICAAVAVVVILPLV